MDDERGRSLKIASLSLNLQVIMMFRNNDNRHNVY